MADRMEEAYQSTLSGFLQAAETGTRIGAQRFAIMQAAKSMEMQLKESQAQMEREDIANTLEAVLGLARMESNERVARIYGGRQQRMPNLFQLLNTGERLSTDITRRNELFKAVSGTPQANNRHSLEVMEINKEMAALNMSNPQNKEYIKDRIDELSRKYTIGNIAGRATMEVYGNTFWDKGKPITKEISQYTIMSGFNPELAAKVRDAVYGDSERKPVYINEGDDMITKKANMYDVLRKVFTGLYSNSERRLMVDKTGYKDINTLTRDFVEIWLNPGRSKDNPIVENVLQTLNQKGFYLASGGVITPMEASMHATMAENMQSWEMLDRINAAGRSMAGAHLGEEQLFSPPKDSIIDYNTANTLIEKQKLWSQGQQEEPVEYTPEIAKFELGEFAPAFVDTAYDGFEAQKALVKYTSNQVSRILNADKNQQHDLILNLIDSLHQHRTKDTILSPMPPFIYENELDSLYKGIVRKKRVYKGLAGSEEKHYGVSR